MSENYTPFKMKGFSGFGEGTKGTPAKLRPDYKTEVVSYGGEDEYEEKTTMISKAEKAALDKQLANPDYRGNVLSTHSTGVSEAASKVEALKTTAPHQKGKKKSLRKGVVTALEGSAADPGIIAEEKIQAQKFPEDVKQAVKTVSQEAPKKNLAIGEQTKERAKEASEKLEEEKS